MRVLLIPPTFHYKDGYPHFLSLSDFPAGFAYLASSLKQAGHEVYGLNPNNIIGYASALHMISDIIPKKIAEVKPELIGLGGLCTDYAFLRDAIGIIRKTDPKIPIVLGGQIVNNDAEDIFNILKPDYAIKGEGEVMMVAIADLLPEKGIKEGISAPVDSYYFPDYEPFGIQDMMDNYSMATRLLYRYTRTNPRVMGIVTARGCPFACTFCIDHHRSYRERSIPNIMAEIKQNYEKYKFNILLILDELFAVNKERMKTFCEAVLDGKAKYGWDFDWCFQTHASAKLDLDTLKLARKAGCFSFSYGLESASPIVLRSMNKKITPEQVIEAMKLAEEAGIGFSANLIFGDTAETYETIAESLSFWLTYCQHSFVFQSILAPYPGSELFEVCRQKGMFKDKQEFYENIDKTHFNLTSMSDRDWANFQGLFEFLEKGWLFCKSTIALSKEQDKREDPILRFHGGYYYDIMAKCPYCGEEIHYRDRLPNPKQPFWLGTGCTKCNRKIRVEAR